MPPFLMFASGRASEQRMAPSSFRFYSTSRDTPFPSVLPRSFQGNCLLPYVIFSLLPTSFIIYAQLSALAPRLVPQEPSRWPNWIMATSTELSSASAATEYILDFLEIVVRGVNGANLLPAKKCPPRLRQLQFALKCLEAWTINLLSKYASAIPR